MQVWSHWHASVVLCYNVWFDRAAHMQATIGGFRPIHEASLVKTLQFTRGKQASLHSERTQLLARMQVSLPVARQSFLLSAVSVLLACECVSLLSFMSASLGRLNPLSIGARRCIMRLA